MYGRTGSLNKTSKKVIDLTTGIVYDSALEASRKLNLCFSHICSVARGVRGSTGDRVFRYLDAKGNIIQPPKVVPIKSYSTYNNILDKYQYLAHYTNTVPSKQK